jgi:hypothetical protein
MTNLLGQTWYLMCPDALGTNGVMGVAVNQEVLEEAHVL